MGTILVVDDTALHRESVAKLLEHEGYQTIKAANGKEGWATLYEQTPDLILLDLMMPAMDGITFLQLLRKDHRWKDLPVIVLTGRGEDKKLVARAWDLKIKELVNKSNFGFEELLSEIKKHLPSAAPPA